MSRQILHPRTVVINRLQKIQSKKTRLKALQWLAVKFPKAFDNSTKIQPLKIGIMVDILQNSQEALAMGFSKSKLREAVVLYTRRIDYLTCLKARNMRIDLEGNPIAEVTIDEAKKAANKIKKRTEKSFCNSRKPLHRRDINPKKTSISQYGLNPLLTHSYHNEGKPLYNMPNVQSSKPPVIKYKSSRRFALNLVSTIRHGVGLKQKDNEPVA